MFFLQAQQKVGNYGWPADEVFFSDMIHGWSKFPLECEFIERDSRSDRVDRSLQHSWDPAFLHKMRVSNQLVDAHVLLPSHMPQYFRKLLMVLNEYLGDEDFVNLLRFSSSFFEMSHH